MFFHSAVLDVFGIELNIDLPLISVSTSMGLYGLDIHLYNANLIRTALGISTYNLGDLSYTLT